jgi:uncharacterized protein YjiS (DUF1127 family)
MAESMLGRPVAAANAGATRLARAALDALRSITQGGVAFLKPLADTYRLWRARRRQLSELRRLSDGQLAELGLCASDIDYVFEATCDPRGELAVTLGNSIAFPQRSPSEAAATLIALPPSTSSPPRRAR